MAEDSLNWEDTKEYFDSVFDQYKEMLGMPGVMAGPAIMFTFDPLERRYQNGERTKKLHDEMMAVE